MCADLEKQHGQANRGHKRTARASSKSVARRLSRNEWKRFTGSYRRPLNQRVFPPESGELNRECSVSARLSVAVFQKKGPVELMDAVWAERGWEAFHSPSLCAPLNSSCPRRTLPKHPSFPRWLFVLFVIRLRFPVNVFQPELLINVIIFRPARHGFSDKMKKYVMNQTNYDSSEDFYHNQIFMLSINILTGHYLKTDAVREHMPPPRPICELIASLSVLFIYDRMSRSRIYLDPSYIASHEVPLIVLLTI